MLQPERPLQECTPFLAEGRAKTFLLLFLSRRGLFLSPQPYLVFLFINVDMAGNVNYVMSTSRYLITY